MKLFAKITVALLMTSLILVGPAGASTNINTKTKLTASKTTVQRGSFVTFKIAVTAKNKKCYANQRVKWFKNGHFKKYRKLGPGGKTKFKLKMKKKKDKTYQAKYPGREFGKHPHHHICDKSHSKVIKIHVTPRHH